MRVRAQVTPKQLFLRPYAADMVVRDPVTKRALPAQGAHVPDSAYWRRRLQAGDVVEGPAPTLSKEA